MELHQPKFKILEGDAYYQLIFLKPESIDTVFTSPEPPYNYQQLEELEQILLQLPRVLKPTGSIWINMGDMHNDDGVLTLIPQRLAYDMVIEYCWQLRGEIIWYRLQTVSDSTTTNKPIELPDKRRFRRAHEYCLWFVKDVKQHYFPELHPTSSDVIESVYYPSRPGVFESGFPIDLIEKTAILTTPPGGRILDPFCGTGTTGIAALNNGMEFLGIEANPALIPKLKQRLNDIVIIRNE